MSKAIYLTAGVLKGYKAERSDYLLQEYSGNIVSRKLLTGFHFLKVPLSWERAFNGGT